MFLPKKANGEVLLKMGENGKQNSSIFVIDIKDYNEIVRMYPSGVGDRTLIHYWRIPRFKSRVRQGDKKSV